MVYLSTDYVFDGQGTTPWEPDFKGYKPLNVYGETKLGGEEAVANTLDKYFIVRIAWVFGVNGSNFIPSGASPLIFRYGNPKYTINNWTNNGVLLNSQT